MSEDQHDAPRGAPQWPRGQTPLESGEALGMRRDEPALNRFLGGSPGAVFVRLLFVSLIVGAFLMWLDISPGDIFRAIRELFDRIWGLGFDAIRVIGDYILAGAAIVVPVWLVLRLLNMRGAR